MDTLVFINNREFYNLIKNDFLDSGFDMVFYDDINAFHHVMPKKTNISAFIICESTPRYISNIRDNLVMLRYYKYCEPVIILSFLPFGYLPLEKYSLTGFTLDHSHHWLQLPVSIDKIKETITVTQCLDKNIVLPFVISNQSVIDHILSHAIENKTKNKKKYKNDIDMEKHVIKILLVEDNDDDVNNTIHNLYKFNENELQDSTLELKIIHFKDGASLIEMLKKLASTQLSEESLNSETEEILDVQCVLLDWLLLENSGAKQSLSEYKLVKKIKSFRPELPVYIYSRNDGYNILDECNWSEENADSENNNLIERIQNQMNGLIAGFFTKSQLYTDPASVFWRIINDYNKRKEAPFWEAYKKYIRESNDSWHTPGHARGISFRESEYLKEFYDFFGVDTFAADLSVSVDQLGSLLNSTNFVKQAQDKVARTFASKHVFFSTNGSSTSNKIIIQTMIRPGDGVIIDRNCHKSVHYGVIQAQAGYVAYLESDYSEKYKIFAPPSIKEIELKIETAKQECNKLKALIITDCTYDGMLIDVNRVVEIAHKNGLKVFIDEAWFAYAGFHPMLRRNSAIFSNADYITHSTHKVLSAFSQASYIHVNDPDFDESYFREIFYIYTSTSPQYQIIASLDVASMQMEMEGYKKITQIITRANRFRKQIAALDKIKIVGKDDFKREFEYFEDDKINQDPLKVLIDISNLKYDIQDIHDYLLREGGLEIEKTTTSTILVLFTMGTSPDKEYRLYKALKDLNNGRNQFKHVERKDSEIKTGDFPPIRLQGNPSLAFFYEKREELDLDKIEDLCRQEKIVSVKLVTPYPPGIPLLIPNQLITRKHIGIIRNLSKNNVEIHGFHNGKMWIAKNSEVNK